MEFAEKAAKDFKKLDAEIHRKIRHFIDTKLLPAENPRLFGKALSGNLKEFWRYRIGDYRLICEFMDHKLIIIVVKIDHRRKVYKNLRLLKSSCLNFG